MQRRQQELSFSAYFAQHDLARLTREAFQIFDVRQRMHNDPTPHIKRLAQALDVHGLRHSAFQLRFQTMS